MEVINVDVYSGRPNDPVDSSKIEELCKDGWFPVSVNVPRDLGQVSYKVTAILVKRGYAKNGDRLDEIEKKLDNVITLFSGSNAKSAKMESPVSGKGKKKGK